MTSFMPEGAPGQGSPAPAAPTFVPTASSAPGVPAQVPAQPPVAPQQPAPQFQAPPSYVPSPTQAAGSPQAAGVPQAAGAPQTAGAPVVQRQPFIPQATQGQPPVRPTAPAQPASFNPAPAQPAPTQPTQQQPAQPARPAAPPATGQQPTAAEAPASNAGRHFATPARARVGMNNEVRQDDFDLSAALRAMLAAKASDLHLTVGAAPTIRVDGGLAPLDGFHKLEPEELQRVIYSILTQKQREDFEQTLELDLAYSLAGEARFRVNVYMQRESIGAAFRVIPYEILPLEQLGIPQIVGTFAGLPRGLVLVTGPTGSGKSTTLASIIDMANRSRADHIMTVEDPIEFLHSHKKSVVNQREVGTDTQSFANALKHVLRQDPDIILVGEMRDLETISVALTAAETGHLVFGTLHTQDAAQTIDRVIDVFPAHQQDQIRVQLATALQGVVCQTLCKRADGPGRAVATEVMVATSAIRNLIREGKTHQIYSSMQAGSKQGMHTMDQHLANLVKAGKITYDTGLEKCHHTEEFNRLSGRSGGQAQGATAAGQAF
ncbi:PilT/PilU family type 4a pilus ATPase [Demequina sp. NBRC 110054]|uniref:PilT/PilU family type 4a pilus ATPase n=1 Tax=Demequina sp. NBRC 110054 TaxID=1570343 RepID=UPI0026F43EDD|nr:PilT/PilU family type 4a pilus ATPase [Demequina sp. NBRC 110054]